MLLYISAVGQKRKIKYSCVNTVGLVAGNQGQALSIETINGLYKDRWFAGIGAGLDLYADRTVPLFVDIRRDITKAKNTPFVYVDGGLNFLWLNSIQKEQRGFPSTSPGGFYGVGFGWKLSGKNRRAIVCSAGYSFKQAKEKIPSFDSGPYPDFNDKNFDRYSFVYRTIVIRLGFQL